MATVLSDGGFGYDEAVVWVADTVQTELVGYEFVQWPSEGCHLFLPPPGIRAPRGRSPQGGSHASGCLVRGFA